MEAFLALKRQVNEYNDQNDKDVDTLRDTSKTHHQRLNDLESQIDLIKKMNRPAKDGESGGPDILELLQDIQDKMRKEFDEKLDALREELLKRIEQLEKKDSEQQEEIDMCNKLFMKHETSIEDLQLQIDQLKRNKVDQDDFDKEIHELRLMIQALGSGKPIEIKTVASTGPKISEKDIARWNSAADITERQETKIKQIMTDLEDF